MNKEWHAGYYQRNRAKIREQERQRKAKNPEAFLASARARKAKYRASHLELERARGRAHGESRYRTHGDIIKKKCKAYRDENPERVRLSRHARRAKLLGATIGDPIIIYRWCKRWISSDSVKCYWCLGFFKGKECHADHVVPLARGGSHSIGNMCIACAPCNQRKHAKSISDWNKRLIHPVLEL